MEGKLCFPPPCAAICLFQARWGGCTWFLLTKARFWSHMPLHPGRAAAFRYLSLHWLLLLKSGWHCLASSGFHIIQTVRLDEHHRPFWP